jgi:ATP-dependent DNA helicase RecQ
MTGETLMPERLQADPTLHKCLVKILERHDDGLPVARLREVLVRDHGCARTPTAIETQLRVDPNRFVLGAHGAWRLVVEAPEGIPEEQRLPEDDREPFCVAPPDLSQYIAFDVETTGLDHENDRIFQLAAVRVQAGRPATGRPPADVVFSEYIDLAGHELPYSLKLKLGLVDHPEWQEQLDAASPLEEVITRFREWAGDVPLVAHNAAFDLGFLRNAGKCIGWEVSNPVLCTLELAVLACPELPRHRLEDLAEHFAVQMQVDSWLDEMGLAPSLAGTFHNAATDACHVVAIAHALQQRLQERAGRYSEFRDAAWQLMPQLCRRLDLPSGPPHSPSPPLSDETDEAPPGTAADAEVPEVLDPEVVGPWFSKQVAAHDLRSREAQLEMVRQVSRCLRDGGLLAVEAPTGTGKTFGYLAPCAVAARAGKRPIFISTHTRLLQDQLASDLTRLNTQWGLLLVGQTLKGRNNYLCRRQFAMLCESLRHPAAEESTTGSADAGATAGLPTVADPLPTLSPQQRFALLGLISWRATTREGLLEEVSFWLRMQFPAVEALCAQVRAEWGRCPEDRCHGCYHAAAYARAATADVVITNHALLLAKEWDEEVLFPTYVILDEAHKLEDAATDADTVEVSRATVMRLLRQLHDPRSGQGLLIRLQGAIRSEPGKKLVGAARDRARGLANHVYRFAERLQHYCDLNGRPWDVAYGVKLRLHADPRKANPVSWAPVEDETRTVMQLLEDLSRMLAGLCDLLAETPLDEYQDETMRQLEYLQEKLVEQASTLDALLRVGYDPLKRVHWVELEADGGEKATSWAIKSAPVRVGELLAERLYDRASAVVLTSATLGTTRDQGFAFVLDRLGLAERLDADRAITLPHAFDYSRALFAVARYLEHDARPSEKEQFEEEISQELRQFCVFGEGNALCLFTARRRMERAFEAMWGDLGAHGIPVGMQSARGSRRALLDEIRERPGSVVLGLKSFWEGVDVPGPNLRYVTMDKLPFPLLGDPIINARSDEIRASGGHEFADYLLPLMLTDFKQGFGRLIRSEDDIGVVLVLDKRIWNKEYLADLRAALPGDAAAGNTVKEPPGEVLLERRRVYEAIIEHLRRAPPEWGLDLETMAARLEQVPVSIVLDLAARLAELAVPEGADLDDPEIWQRVLGGLREFGHGGFRGEQQEQAVRAMLQGEDALVVLPTGSGKSLTFQLPALLTAGTTLVFSPLLALMKDQVDKLADHGLPIADRLDGSQSAEDQERVFERMRLGHTRLLYIAPERVRDPRLMAALRNTPNVVRAVIDEAHCLHEWGQSFRPDFLYIRQLVDQLSGIAGRRIPLAALTATATPRVRESIAAHLHLAEPYREIESSPDRPELHFVVYNSQTVGNFRITSRRAKLRVLLRLLRCADRKGESVVVYTSTTRQAERLVESIRLSGLEARCYHGKLDDQERRETQDMFIDGQVSTIVATKAFGMGIDKPDIRYVIHYELPGNVEAYFQEAGRAGRDGKPSYCILLYHPADLRVHEEYFIPNSAPDRNQLASLQQHLLKTMPQGSATPLYVDDRDLVELLGLDEQHLGLHLHLLEQAALIRRDFDITLAASCRLLVPLEQIAAKATALSERPQLAEAVVRMLGRCVGAMERAELRTVSEAQLEGVSPREADDLLYQLALEGLLIYRPFARALSLFRGDHTGPGGPPDNHVAVQQEMRGNLGRMQRYAASARAEFCYRRYLLDCLGAPAAAPQAERCCGHCCPNEHYPWLDEDVTIDPSDPERHLDVGYALLQAVSWNAQLPQTKDRPPYGLNQLIRLLLGNDYVQPREGDEPWQTARRRRALNEAEHFGRLENLRNGEERLQLELEALRRGGLVEIVTREAEGWKYEYPMPTQNGSRRLAEGRLLGGLARR